MTDILDEATDTEMREREALVQARQARAALHAQLAAAREATRSDGPAICVGCEEPIPEPRRVAVPGCLRCTGCEHQRSSRTSAPR